MKQRIKVIVDAMGGDFAPQSAVEGSVDACREYNSEIILVGKEKEIKSELNKLNFTGLPISIVNASEVVEMHDNPLDVIKKKKDSSINVAMNLLNDGGGDAFFSAGNSGAVATAGLFILKRIKGIDRPSIATIMPTMKEHAIVTDAGATNLCKPFNLVQFAIMGAVYSKYFLKRKDPTVGILSNGEEETKGTDTIKEAHQLLKKSSLNYLGFVEGKEVFNGSVDVVVCDGFTGNIVLKVAEGVAGALGSVLKEELTGSLRAKIGLMFSKSALLNFKKRFNYEEIGGAPLLGVRKPIIFAHGRSNPYTIKNAIRTTIEFTEANVIYHIENDLEINNDLHILGKKPSFISKVFKDINLKKPPAEE
jgi:glycerol-3-phosphate acyltransferase PlsX